MGRVKLKIKRLESTSNRQITFAKRKNGISKKAKELAILCDIDIILLMFSPTGKPSAYFGERGNYEQVVVRFAQLSPQERAKRKLESLEALKKTFKKLDHDVNIEDFVGRSNQTAEELTAKTRLLKAHIAESHKRLSYWRSPNKIDDVEQLQHMEDSLTESLNQIRIQKENIRKHQMLPLDCSRQFQNEMHLPFMMSSLQGSQPPSWLMGNDSQPLVLPNDLKFLPQRDLKCTTDASLPGYHGYYGNVKMQVNNSRHCDNIRSDCGCLSELSGTGFSGVQIGEQYPYSPYGNLNLPEEKKVIKHNGTNFQGNTLDYQVCGNFDLASTIYDTRPQPWAPAAFPCPIPMFSDNAYPHASRLA